MDSETQKKLINWVINQGLAISILVYFTLEYSKKIENLEKSTELCQKYIIQELRSERDTLLNTIEKNNNILNNFKNK